LQNCNDKLTCRCTSTEKEVWQHFAYEDVVEKFMYSPIVFRNFRSQQFDLKCNSADSNSALRDEKDAKAGRWRNSIINNMRS